jgi:hypothetical protein
VTSRSFLSAFALVLCSLLAAGCGGTKKVDSSTVEKGIESQIHVLTAKPASVNCPDNVESKAGQTFTCTATLSNGAEGKVKVDEPKKGQFEYSLVPGSLMMPGAVLEDKVKKDLEQAGVSNASVNCPDNVIIKVGTTVTCDVKSSTKTGKVTFTFSDASGTVDSSSVKTS